MSAPRRSQKGGNLAPKIEVFNRKTKENRAPEAPRKKIWEDFIRFELIRSDRSNFQVLNGTNFVFMNSQSTYIRLELISQNPPLGGLISEKS